MDVWFCFRAGINGQEATDAKRNILIRSMRALLSAQGHPRFPLDFDLHRCGLSVSYHLRNITTSISQTNARIAAASAYQE
jgi:hypothetical protein